MDIFSKNQFGFVSGRSTTDAIHHTLDYVYKEIDKGNAVLGYFFDLTRAFDTVDYDMLLRKLWIHGIRGVLYDLLTSYLTGRKSVVSIKGSVDGKIIDFCSSIIDVKCGEPQGSILGPTLFVIYVSDLHMSLPSCLITDDDDVSCVIADSTLDAVSVRAIFDE